MKLNIELKTFYTTVSQRKLKGNYLCFIALGVKKKHRENGEVICLMSSILNNIDEVKITNNVLSLR